MVRWVLLALLVVALTLGATIGRSLLDISDTSAPDTASDEEWPPGGIAAVEGDSTLHEFGSMSQYEKGAFSFIVRNDGDDDLRLRYLTSNCGCTIAKMESDKDVVVVKPGTATPVELNWTTKDSNGEFKKYATIATSDPKRSQIDFRVEGYVYPAVSLFPPEPTISFERIPHDKPQDRMLALFSPDRGDLAVTGSSSSRPGLIEVSTEPMDDKDRETLHIKEGGLRLKVILKPGLGIGPFRENLVIQTNHSKKPQIELTLTGHVEGPVSCAPGTARDLNVDGRTGGQVTVRLTCRGTTPVEYTVVQAPSPLKVEITPDATAGASGLVQHLMTVSVPPGTDSTALFGEITLKTNLPGAETLKVPVHFVVRGASAADGA